MEKNLIVAFGGASPEHEVSVLTAMQAISALENSPYKIRPLYIAKNGKWYSGEYLLDLKHYEDLDKLTKQASSCHFTHNELGQAILTEVKSGLFSKNEEYIIHAVLTAFHGAAGENGSFQGVCEMYNIPYTGSGVMGSAVGMDKVTAKALCKSAGIPVVDGTDFFENQWVDEQDNILNEIDKLNYPVIVKPVHLGSSIGVKVCPDQETLIEAVEIAFRFDEHLLVEKAISPLTEINCSVMGSSRDCRASVCERPMGTEELLSFKDKYMRDDAAKGMASADRVIPADIPDSLSSSIQDTSKKVFGLFNCSGLARLDFLVESNTENFYFNEINTIPGSFSFYLWKESGIDFDQLLQELIKLAVSTHQKKNGRVLTYETNLLSQKAVKGIKGLKGNK
ncbi:D-alanine--D-alanine ligase [Rhodohalobacter sp.]|uniref:D-alanine--D-alanine ligase n=1 Tax=Rhodohalobacter sp. TaxID=1974210 RepID=UPI002ACD252A|nr:D-alanine--D-alanine ligase [Rhodohalobacter sp.]MDZ7755701.1 D-alanine--D-alanine ligase [Rhodohalobacter sp.]